MNWDNIEGGVVILGDDNAHSLKWNLHCGERRDAAGLETLIKRHGLILNNELGVATRPTRSRRTSIIDLTFTTLDIGAPDTLVFDEEL